MTTSLGLVSLVLNVMVLNLVLMTIFFASIFTESIGEAVGCLATASSPPWLIGAALIGVA